MSEPGPIVNEVAPAASRPLTLPLRLVQLGAIAIVPAVAVLHVFELDRFFVPKELVLHLFASLAALFALRRLGHSSFTRIDRLLVGFHFLSGVSAALATNGWVAFRAIAISVSGMLLFWSARAVRESGRGWSTLKAAGVAITLVVVSALLQTYGVSIDLFSENRAPGGTLGNRNFVAHVAAFGWPVLVVLTLAAQRTGGFLVGATAVGLATATLVLTRSRGGWLAFALGAATLLVALLFAPAARRERRTWLRLAGIILLSGAGVAAALLIPNTLRWRSDNPYLESVKRVADYQEGSGRGRLIQYERSLIMAAKNPIFGVGPGNWPVKYPRHAARRDPSLDDANGGMTSNPWPSSDWIAFISERGPMAALLLALAFAGLLRSGVRQLRGSIESDASLRAAALIATIVSVLVAGAFDAVLLLALPALLVWVTLGTLWEPQPEMTVSWSPAVKRIVVLAALIVSAAGAARSVAQLTAMQLYASNGSRAELERAARIDPGNYRLRLRLARGGRNRCKHARAAADLLPHASASQRAARGCD